MSYIFSSGNKNLYFVEALSVYVEEAFSTLRLHFLWAKLSPRDANRWKFSQYVIDIWFRDKS